MDNQKLIKLNTLVNKAYESASFVDFLKIAILSLHELVVYDSGMFFCAISRDSSFFKPYISGSIEEYYNKQSFTQRQAYIDQAELNEMGKEAYIFTSAQYSKGTVKIANEPRSDFLLNSKEFHIACLRIIFKGQFLGEIYLHRSADKQEFSEEDMFVLKLLQPHISTIFNNIHSQIAAKHIESSNISGTKKGMCMLDSELSIASGNIIGIEMLKTATAFGSSILFHVKELCIDAVSEDKSFCTTIIKTQHGNVQIDIFIKRNKAMSTETQFVVVMEFLNEEQMTADYKFKFSKREAEIIDGLIQGKNNFQLAKTLNLSENTIKTHIKSIYKKTGVANRTELAYLLMLNAG